MTLCHRCVNRKFARSNSFETNSRQSKICSDQKSARPNVFLHPVRVANAAGVFRESVLRILCLDVSVSVRARTYARA